MSSRLAALIGLILFRILRIPSTSKKILSIYGYFCMTHGVFDICCFVSIVENWLTTAFALLSLEIADDPVGVFNALISGLSTVLSG